MYFEGKAFEISIKTFTSKKYAIFDIIQIEDLIKIKNKSKDIKSYTFLLVY